MKIDSWRATRHFLLQRVVRIYPAYWLALGVLALVRIWIDAPLVSTHAWKSILLLEPKHELNWLHIAWSLSYELYFYCLIALGFTLFRGGYRLFFLATLALIIFTWTFAWYRAAPLAVFEGREPFRFLISALALEFLFGATLATWIALKKFRIPTSAAALGVILIVAGLWKASQSAQIADLAILRAGTLGVVGFGALLVALALESTFSPPRWLVSIGAASFSLYLLHPIWIDYLNATLFKTACKAGALGCKFWLWSAVIAIIPMSLLWFQFIENPLHQRLRRGVALRFAEKP